MYQIRLLQLQTFFNFNLRWIVLQDIIYHRFGYFRKWQVATSPESQPLIVSMYQIEGVWLYRNEAALLGMFRRRRVRGHNVGSNVFSHVQLEANEFGWAAFPSKAMIVSSTFVKIHEWINTCGTCRNEAIIELNCADCEHFEVEINEIHSWLEVYIWKPIFCVWSCSIHT